MSSTLISILVSAVVAIILLISFFVGRKRGVQRTLLDAGLTLAFLILAFFLTPIITNAFMGISITLEGKTATIGTFLSTYLMDNKDFGVYVENSSSLQAFLDGVVPAVASIIVFILLCLIFKLIEHIIYKIIEKLAFKSKAEEEEEGLSRNKIGGGILSAVKTLVFAVFVFLPLTSLAGFLEKNFFSNYAEGSAEASSITDSLDSLPSTSEISNEIPSEVKKAVAGYNNSVVGFCGNIFGLDDVCFDYLSNIKVRGNNVSIRQTAESLLGFYDYALDLYDEYKKAPKDFFKNLDYEEFDKYKKEIFESGMFKGFVLNVVYDYTQKYDKLLGQDFVDEYGTILNDIKTHLAKSKEPTDDLLNDIYRLFDIVESAGKTGLLDEINAMGESASAEDIIFLVVEDYSNSFVTTTVDAVFNINIIRASFESMLEEVKSQLGDSKEEEALKLANGKITDWQAFINGFNDILTDVGELYDHLQGAGVVVEDFIDDYYLILKARPSSIEPAIVTIGGMLDKIDNLELMKGKNNTKVLNAVLDAIGFGDLLDGIVAEGQTVNYSYAFNKVAKAVRYLLEYDLYNEVKAGDYKEIICKIADGVYKDSLETYPAGVLTKQEKLEEVFKIIYNLPKFKELTIDEFVDDLSAFVDLNVLNDEAVRDQELRYMTQILIELSKNKITVNETEISYLKYLLNDSNKFEGLIGSIKKENIPALLTPILKSKLTNGICTELFNTIASTLSDAAGETITITYINGIFNNDNDQVTEVCNTFAKFLDVYNLGDISSIEDVGYANLGALLEEMKNNAYRNELHSNRTDGIFRNAFDKVVASAEETYGNISFAKVLRKANVYEVNFITLFDFVEVVEENPSEFTTNLKNLFKEETADKSTTIENMLDSINSSNYGDETTGVKAILSKAQLLKVTVDVTGVTITAAGEEKAVAEGIDVYEFDTSLTETQKTELKAYLKILLTTTAAIEE